MHYVTGTDLYRFLSFLGLVSPVGCLLEPMLGSMEKPSISLLNSSGERLLASSSVAGHWNLPSTSRMYNRINRSPSHNNPLMRSFLVPQNRNRVPFSRGSSPYLKRMAADRPSIPILMSVLPTAIRHRLNVRPSALSMGHLTYYRSECILVNAPFKADSELAERYVYPAWILVADAIVNRHGLLTGINGNFHKRWYCGYRRNLLCIRPAFFKQVVTALTEALEKLPSFNSILFTPFSFAKTAFCLLLKYREPFPDPEFHYFCVQKPTTFHQVIIS